MREYLLREKRRKGKRFARTIYGGDVAPPFHFIAGASRGRFYVGTGSSDPLKSAIREKSAFRPSAAEAALICDGYGTTEVVP